METLAMSRSERKRLEVFSRVQSGSLGRRLRRPPTCIEQ